MPKDPSIGGRRAIAAKTDAKRGQESRKERPRQTCREPRRVGLKSSGTARPVHVTWKIMMSVAVAVAAAIAACCICRVFRGTSPMKASVDLCQAIEFSICLPTEPWHVSQVSATGQSLLSRGVSRRRFAVVGCRASRSSVIVFRLPDAHQSNRASYGQSVTLQTRLLAVFNDPSD